jgi:hypothetical protein
MQSVLGTRAYFADQVDRRRSPREQVLNCSNETPLNLGRVSCRDRKPGSQRRIEKGRALKPDAGSRKAFAPY